MTMAHGPENSRPSAHEARRPASAPRRAVRSRSRFTPRGPTVVLNFAPMIDVTFLLLIFFLVTTTFERAEGLLTSKLPKDAGAPSVDLPLTPIVIRLARTGSEHDAVSIRIDRFEHQPASIDELAASLRAIHNEPGFDEETPVVIAAQDDVPWDHVVGCWNAALRANCKRVAFAEP